LERNWKRWKNIKPAEEVKGRLTAVHEVVEEKRGKIEEWIKEDKMGQLKDTSNKL